MVNVALQSIFGDEPGNGTSVVGLGSGVKVTVKGGSGARVVSLVLNVRMVSQVVLPVPCVCLRVLNVRMVFQMVLPVPCVRPVGFPVGLVGATVSVKKSTWTFALFMAGFMVVPGTHPKSIVGKFGSVCGFGYVTTGSVSGP